MSATSRSLSFPCGECSSPPAAGVFLHTCSSQARAGAEALIRASYRSAYGARVSEFLPFLLELRHDDAVAAVLGMRPARRDEHLFLEQYLDRPIEQEIAAATGRPVLRGDIVEIGNLAAAARGLSVPLFLVMAAALAAADYRWLAFTATPQVERIVAKMNYAPLCLRPVDPARIVELLGGRAAQWGTYYETRPRVMCCDLATALHAGSQLSRVAGLLQAYGPAIERVARQLRASKVAP